MIEILRPHLDRRGKRGGQPKLNVEDQLLIVLEYWWEYRTQFHIATSWGLSESAVSVDPEGRNTANEFWQVSLTGSKAARSECSHLASAGSRCD